MLLDRIDSPKDLRQLSLEELPRLAGELRALITEVTQKNGGHLGGSLGAVELGIALHYVFDSPRDPIIWDVGHQAYAHKILTGRRDRFATLRQPGGISGFLKRSESEHDVFGAGHASTAISAALGISEGLGLRGEPGRVIAVVGDGALTGGLAFEGLNNAGVSNRPLIIVVNDNGMSISNNVGALSRWLGRPGGQARALFEGLGFAYQGPLDGHDISALVEEFKRAAAIEAPVILHVKTNKGHGLDGVEQHHERCHGVTPSASKAVSPARGPSYTQLFSQAICELGAADERLVAITAGMKTGSGLADFAERFPERFFDVGIAEEHAITFAAGLAAAGMRPVCAIYSSFMQRAFDQVIHDVCLQNLPVIFCLDRAGLVGDDGPTHHGLFDIAYLRMIPNMSLLAPSNGKELRQMMWTALTASRPVALRWPRGEALPGRLLSDSPTPLPWGKGEVVFDAGNDLLLLAAGPLVQHARAAAEQLGREGIACTVINARFLKPLDEALLVERIGKTGALITIEEGCRRGGFGAAVLELCDEHGLAPRSLRLGIADQFVDHGEPASLRAAAGLDASSIASAGRKLFDGRAGLRLRSSALSHASSAGRKSTSPSS